MYGPFNRGETPSITKHCDQEALAGRSLHRGKILGSCRWLDAAEFPSVPSHENTDSKGDAEYALGFRTRMISIGEP